MDILIVSIGSPNYCRVSREGGRLVDFDGVD